MQNLDSIVLTLTLSKKIIDFVNLFTIFESTIKVDLILIFIAHALRF
jgi:hypothetical protein